MNLLKIAWSAALFCLGIAVGADLVRFPTELTVVSVVAPIFAGVATFYLSVEEK